MVDQPRLLAGWGRTAPTAARVVRIGRTDDLAQLIVQRSRRGVIARGLGRSYGDAAQNAGGTVVDMTALADPVQEPNQGGVISCDAGLSIASLLQTSVPARITLLVAPRK